MSSSGHATDADGQPAPPVDPVDQRVWIVDPLDGTVNYANGIPMFCVSIGLTIGGRPMIGVVYDPTRDEMFTAQAGMGAGSTASRFTIPSKEKLSRLRRFAVPAAPRLGRRVTTTCARRSACRATWAVPRSRSRTWPTAASTRFVQAGGLSLWDICAAGLIAIEGGVRLTSLDGGPWFEISRPTKSIALLGAAPKHHQTLLEMLR